MTATSTSWAKQAFTYIEEKAILIAIIVVTGTPILVVTAVFVGSLGRVLTLLPGFSFLAGVILASLILIAATLATLVAVRR